MGVELQKPAGTEFALDALVIPLRLPAGYPCRLKNLDQYPTNRRSLSVQYWALGLRLIGAPIPNSAARPKGQQHRQCHALPTRVVMGGLSRPASHENRSALTHADSCRKMLRSELWTRISPLYSMNPSFLKRFIKKSRGIGLCQSSQPVPP